MAHDTGPDLDHLILKAGQRPFGHGLGQFDAVQERAQIVGQYVQLQPYLAVANIFCMTAVSRGSRICFP